MEAIINYMYERNKACIYLRDGNTFFGYDGNNVIAYEVKPTECLPEDMKPLLTVATSFVAPILKALADAAKEEGIGTKNEDHLKGKLEATELHLSDMREFAKILLDKQVK